MSLILDDYSAIGALGGAVQGFTKGMVDAEDRKMKQMEFQAKQKAEEREVERERFRQALDLRKANLIKTAEGGLAPDMEAQRREDVIKAPTGQLPKYDEQGRLIGFSVDPDYEQSQIRIAGARAAIDPYGTKSKPTEGEFLSAGFAKRMKGAEAALKSMQQQGFDPTSQRVAAQGLLGGRGMLGRLTEGAKDNDVKQFEQIKRNFVSAVLRKESGAAISPQEYAEEEKKYFPQAGDSPEVIAQKEQARAQAIANLTASSGRAFDRIPEIKGPPPAAPKSSGPKVGTVESGFRFKGGDPADSKNWEKVK